MHIYMQIVIIKKIVEERKIKITHLASFNFYEICQYVNVMDPVRHIGKKVRKFKKIFLILTII